MVLSEQAAVENVMFDNPEKLFSHLAEHITSHVQSLGLITTALLRRTKLEEWQLLNQTGAGIGSRIASRRRELFEAHGRVRRKSASHCRRAIWNPPLPNGICSGAYC